MIRFILAFLFFFTSIHINSQVSHEVTVGGGGSSGITPYYSPQFLTINEGDTVRWFNVQGVHNVDGSLATYPGNPEGFLSGTPAQGWEFEHVFTIPGSYGFQCSQDDHATSQFGIVMVTDIVGLEENTLLDFYIYPNPAESEINILKKGEIDRVEIMDISRNVKISENIVDFRNTLTLNINDLSPGLYYVIIYHDKYKGIRRFIKN